MEITTISLSSDNSKLIPINEERPHMTLVEYAERRRLLHFQYELNQHMRDLSKEKEELSSKTIKKEFVTLDEYIELKSIKSEWIEMDKSVLSSLDLEDEENILKLKIAAQKYHNRIFEKTNYFKEKSISSIKQFLSLEEYAKRKQQRQLKYFYKNQNNNLQINISFVQQINSSSKKLKKKFLTNLSCGLFYTLFHHQNQD
ncbi:hypothetical protein I4U23_005758 [Adineta vaga]|nr:hypothetical protein I4U23_005758 [Adineta vaga]